MLWNVQNCFDVNIDESNLETLCWLIAFNESDFLKCNLHMLFHS